MKKKNYILALTFLCMLCAQVSYGFDDEGNTDEFCNFDWNSFINDMKDLLGEEKVFVYENLSDFIDARNNDDNPDNDINNINDLIDYIEIFTEPEVHYEQSWDDWFKIGEIQYGERNGVLYYDENKDGYPETKADHDPRDKHETFTFDANGYDQNGYDVLGFDQYGYNINGYDWWGYDEDGYDANGYNRFGYHENGYDINGDNDTNYLATTIDDNSGAYFSTIDLIDTNTDPDFIIVDNIVKIKSDDNTYKKPSELNVNSFVNQKAVNKFAASLARGLGGMNKKIYIGSTKANKLSSENQAFTRHPVTVRGVSNANIIFLNTNGGYSTDLDNVNNFKSIVKHEILHADDNNSNVRSNLSTHVDVYINAMKQSEFSKTTRDFQIGTLNSLVNYILNMDKRTDTYRVYYPSEIKQKIDNFNNIAGLDFTFSIQPVDYNTKGTLDISIRDRTNFNTPLIPAPYILITDEK